MKIGKVILFTLLVLTVSVIGQTNNTIKKETKKEIDILADKYKDKPTLTLYTTYGDLKVDSEVIYNDDSKPQAVIVFGDNSNKEATQEFLLKTINQKKKQGYKFISRNSWGSKSYDEALDEGGILTYKKGNLYFLVKTNEYRSYKSSGIFPGDGYHSKSVFEIETGDNSRKGGKNVTKFEF